MSHVSSYLWRLLVASSMAGLLGCASQALPESQDDTQARISTRAQQRPTREGFFSSQLAGCSFSLPSGTYRVDVTQFSSLLPTDQMRRQIQVVPREGKSLARIDIFDKPDGVGLDGWVRQHLPYLLDDDARVSNTSVGKKHLPAVVIDRPRTPQVFSNTTVVLASAERVAVVTGSDVADGERARAFTLLLDSLSLEVTP